MASEKQGKEQGTRRILFWLHAARLAGIPASQRAPVAQTDAARLEAARAALAPEQRALAEKMWETAHAFALNT